MIIAKVIAIFSMTYALVLCLSVSLFYIAFFILDWKTLAPAISQDVGFLLNGLSFVLAMYLALSSPVFRRMIMYIGPLAFKKMIAENKIFLVVGIAVIAGAIDYLVYVFTHQIVLGNIQTPSILRLLIVILAYGIFSNYIISETIKKQLWQ